MEGASVYGTELMVKCYRNKILIFASLIQSTKCGCTLPGAIVAAIHVLSISE